MEKNREENSIYIGKKDIEAKTYSFSKTQLREHKFYEIMRNIPDPALSADTIEKTLAGYSAAKARVYSIGAPKETSPIDVNNFYEMFSFYLGVSSALCSHSNHIEGEFGGIESKLETDKGEYFLIDSFISNYINIGRACSNGKSLAAKTKAYLKNCQAKLDAKLKSERYSKLLGHVRNTKIYFDTNDEKLEFRALDYSRFGGQMPSEAGSEKVVLGNIGGNGRAKRAVEEIVLMYKHPSICKKYAAEIPKGLLFYGPPGTGKTMLAMAMANELGIDFYEVRIDSILSKWVGEAEKNLRMSLEHRKGIIFYDEFDSLGKTKDEHGPESSRNIVNMLATIMEGLSSQQDVINVAATNNLELIDPKLLRAGRFDEIIEFTIPTKDELKEIFGIHLARASLKSGRNLYQNIKLEEIAGKLYKKSENSNGHEKKRIVRANEIFGGIVGADVREIVKRVNRRLAINEIKGIGKDLMPTEQDFIEIIDSYERE